jgi:SAM-dependent methyltransferase
MLERYYSGVCALNWAHWVPADHATNPRYARRARIRSRRIARRLRLRERESVVDLGGQHADVVTHLGGEAARRAVIDPGGAHYLDDHLGVHAYRSIEELATRGDTFDVAISLQTFEHVAAPRELLEALVRVVRPNGKVLLEVPYDLLAFEVGDRSVTPPIDPHPEHLNFFTPSSLRCLAEMSGLEVETVQVMLTMLRFGGMVPSIVAIGSAGVPRRAVTSRTRGSAPAPLTLEVARDRRKAALLSRVHRIINAGLRVGW